LGDQGIYRDDTKLRFIQWIQSGFKTIITAKHLIHIINNTKSSITKDKEKPQRSIGQRQTKHNNYSKASNTNHKKGMLIVDMETMETEKENINFI
jgi:hypothetical protein